MPGTTDLPAPTAPGPGGGAPSGGTGGGGDIPSLGGTSTGSLLQGWDRMFQPPTDPGGWLDVPARPDLGEFAKPDPFAFREFTPTTGEDVTKDPGYQFRFDMGWKPILAGKATEGMLRSGDTLRALTNYGQGFGSQEFGNVDARRRTDFTTARGNAESDYRLNKIEAPLTTFTTNRDTKLAGYDRDLASAGMKADARRQDIDQSWREYLQDWAAFTGDRNFNFDALSWLSDFDLRAATS